MKRRKKRPPKIAEWLLKAIANQNNHSAIIGDLEEEYYQKVTSQGIVFAIIWYWFLLIVSLPSFLSNLFYWRTVLFKNYIKITLRNMKKYKAYSFINIFGLAIGIAASILIFLFVEYQLGFDSFFLDKENIYRVVTHTQRANGTEYNGGTPFPTADALKNDFPQLKNVTQVYRDANVMITIGMDRYKEKAVLYIKPDYFEMFNIEWRLGERSKFLDDPQAVVLSKNLAEKYFGQVDPLGKILYLDNETELHVTGIVANPPAQSSFPFDLLISWDTLDSSLTEAQENWSALYNSCNTFIQLYETSDPKRLEKQFEAFEHRYMEPDNAKKWSFRLQSLRDIHFNPRYDSYNFVTSRIALFAISAIGFVILIIACINFINLSTAQAIKRAREMGIRKVLGANRSQIIRQLFGETSLFTCFAILIGLFLGWFLLPYLNKFLGHHIELQIISSNWLFPFLGMIFLFICGLNGFYPAFMLSRYRPVDALKERLTPQRKYTYSLRNSLVLIQFIISQVLIVGTLVIAAQVNYILTMNLGFRKEGIVTVPIATYEESSCEILRERWQQNPNIQAVSFAWSNPTATSNFTTTLVDNESDELIEFPVYIKMCDKHYLDVYDIRLVAGRFFDRNSNDETDKQWVINETVVRLLGLPDPKEALGKRITVNDGIGVIIGVINDFNVTTLHNNIKPIVFFNFWPENHTRAQIRMERIDVQSTMDHIKRIWSEYFPEHIFEYTFYDDDLVKMYTTESKLLTMIQTATILSILIGCLGLVGLASFMVLQRTKEIGIRKVLGASFSSLYYLISKEFMKWIVFANMFAWPIAYLLTKSWLQEFAFQIQLGVGYFLVGGVVLLGIAVFVVSVQVIRATTANPVNSLQYE